MSPYQGPAVGCAQCLTCSEQTHSPALLEARLCRKNKVAQISVAQHDHRVSLLLHDQGRSGKKASFPRVSAALESSPPFGQRGLQVFNGGEEKTEEPPWLLSASDPTCPITFPLNRASPCGSAQLEGGPGNVCGSSGSAHCGSRRHPPDSWHGVETEELSSFSPRL